MVSRRHATIRDAYDALERGETAPWIGLLDPAAVWRGVDEDGVAEAPT